jgi:putative toxin-antitoxin system antitoxin component (TIGR02293 family)
MIHRQPFPVYHVKIKKKTKSENEYTFAKTLLGLASDNPAMLIRYQKEGLPHSALVRLQEFLDMSDREVSALININQRTLSRRRKQGRLNALESDRLLRLGRLLWKAINVFDKNKVEAKAWLMEPNDLIGNERPVNVINTDIGARQVEDILGSIEWGHVA